MVSSFCWRPPHHDRYRHRRPCHDHDEQDSKRPILQIDGNTWKPREAFATDLGVSEKTAQRLNLKTMYVGGVAYVPVEESLREIASRARRRNEPSRHRRR